MCASCLRKLTAGRGEAKSARDRMATALAAARLVAALALLWFAFYLVGLFLVRAPAGFHDGTIWEEAGR